MDLFEPIHNSVFGIYISEERNMLIAEKFIRSLVEKYGKHNTVYADGGTSYHEIGNMIRLKYYLNSPLEKILMKRVNQYFNDKIESFDNYYPYIQKEDNECNLLDLYNWLQLFIVMYNDTIYNNHFIIQLYEEVINLS
jgi:putative transposase